jgi:hypothetical protein
VKNQDKTKSIKADFAFNGKLLSGEALLFAGMQLSQERAPSRLLLSSDRIFGGKKM